MAFCKQYSKSVGITIACYFAIYVFSRLLGDFQYYEQNKIIIMIQILVYGGLLSLFIHIIAITCCKNDFVDEDGREININIRIQNTVLTELNNDGTLKVTVLPLPYRIQANRIQPI